MSSCTLNPFLNPTDALVLREWYVCVQGGEPVGPVSASQIARGLMSGKVPRHAQVARSGGNTWEDVLAAHAIQSALQAL